MAGFNCTAYQLGVVKQFVADDNAAAAAVCRGFNVTALGPTNAVLAYTLKRLHDVEDTAAQTKHGLDTSFTLTSAYLIFMMQAGFALYAAGVIRSKNVFNILMKNFVDACVAGVAFYCIGYAFAFGQGANSNGFIGASDFALGTADSDTTIWAKFMFQWSFCAASATIMSGAIAERVTFNAYMAYTSIFSAWVYPIVVHWLWTPAGWLSAFNPDPFLGVGAVDFAGSGVVHTLAGFASLMGALLVGPRIGRFDPEVNPADYKGRSASTFVLGTFLLWFGWYGFNPGSFGTISTVLASEVVGRIAVTTTLAGCTAALVAAALGWYYYRKWDLLGTCSGLLAGLVAVTAGCSVLPAWASIVCGIAAAVVYFFMERTVDYMQVDDPVQAFAMHGCCGITGLLFVGLLADEKYMMQVYSTHKGAGLMGVFMGGNGKLLAAQLVAVLVIAGWGLLWSFLIFYPMKRLHILRVAAIEEAVGIDVYHHGEALDSSAFNPNITKFAPGGAMEFVPADGTETPVTLRMDSVGNMHWTPRQPPGFTPASAAYRTGPLPSALLPGNAPAHSTIISSDSYVPSTTSSVELHAQMFGGPAPSRHLEMQMPHQRR